MSSLKGCASAAAEKSSSGRRRKIRVESAPSESADGRKVELGPLTDLVGYRLRKAQLWAFQLFMASLGDSGITPGRFSLLAVIQKNPGLNQAALAEAVDVDRSTMVAMIDKLEAEGWVRRKTSARDRRSYAIHLTKAGRNILDESWPQVLAFEDRVSRSLSKPERQELLRLLSRLTDG